MPTIIMASPIFEGCAGSSTEQLPVEEERNLARLKTYVVVPRTVVNGEAHRARTVWFLPSLLLRHSVQ